MIELDIHKILELLPHRYPFLLIDKVVNIEPNESLTAVKNITYNEPFFQGHFPHRPIMPGVMILEAMAQATGLLAFHSFDMQVKGGTVFYLVGVDKARFKNPVSPGDQLVIEITLQRAIRSMMICKATATVDGKIAAKAELLTTKSDVDS